MPVHSRTPAFGLDAGPQGLTIVARAAVRQRRRATNWLGRFAAFPRYSFVLPLNLLSMTLSLKEGRPKSA